MAWRRNIQYDAQGTVMAVRLAGHVIPVPPQKHGYVRNMLTAAELEQVHMAAVTGGHHPDAYRLLGILIPELSGKIAEHEWHGFASKEAWEAKEYDPENDPGPTDPEIADAWKAVVEASGLNLGKLMDLADTARQALALQQTNGQSTPAAPISAGGTGASD